MRPCLQANGGGISKGVCNGGGISKDPLRLPAYLLFAMSYCLLLTAYCLLLTAYYLLLTTYYLLLLAHYLLLTTWEEPPRHPREALFPSGCWLASGARGAVAVAAAWRQCASVRVQCIACEQKDASR